MSDYTNIWKKYVDNNGMRGLSSLYDRYSRIIFFDTETTGFNCLKGDQLVQLSAIAYDTNVDKYLIMDRYVSLFKMDEMPEDVSKINGITTDFLSEYGVSEKDVMNEFKILCMSKTSKDNGVTLEDPKTLVIAYNAHFDLNFLQEACKRISNDNFLASCDFLDPLTAYRDRHEFPHRLENAIDNYGLSDYVKNSHNSMDDVMALMLVTDCMSKENDNLDQYINRFGYKEKYGIDMDKIDGVTYVAQVPGKVFVVNNNEAVKESKSNDRSKNVDATLGIDPTDIKDKQNEDNIINF